MIIAISRTSRGARRHVSRQAASAIAGPSLSAVRAACELYGEELAGLAPVFDRIGRRLDETLSHPTADEYFSANGRRVVVAVSDARWRHEVLFTKYDVDEIEPLMTKADGFFRSYAIVRGGDLGTTDLADAVCACWVEWSRHARKSFRRRVAAWTDVADVSVGALLLASPDIRRGLDRIAVGGDVPVLAVAINSTHATPTHLKCNVRAFALSLPSWICASGAVAGHG